MSGVWLVGDEYSKAFKALPEIAKGLEVQNRIEVLRAKMQAGVITPNDYAHELEGLIRVYYEPLF